MRLCLSCYHLGPRDGLFCGFCGRSYGGRVCPLRHLSPSGAQVCIHCGRTELTDSTAYVPLGGVSCLITGACLLIGAKWLFEHLGSLMRSAFVLVDAGLSFVFGAGPFAAERLIFWLIVGYLALMLLPGRIGRELRRLVFGTLGFLWLYRSVRDLLRALARSRRRFR